MGILDLAEIAFLLIHQDKGYVLDGLCSVIVVGAYLMQGGSFLWFR